MQSFNPAPLLYAKVAFTRTIWGFPKIRGTFWGVPIIRTTVYGGLYWGPVILGNYHIVRNTDQTSQEHELARMREADESVSTIDLNRVELVTSIPKSRI